MSLDILVSFMVFVFVGSATPGPNNLMLLASGLNFGWWRSLPHIMGIVIGFTLMFFLGALGLIRLFDLFPLLHSFLKIGSLVYLSYLAWKIATAAPLAQGAQAEPKGKPFSFMQAAIFQWINPKAWIVAIAAISSYLPSAFGWQDLLLATTVFALVNLPAISVWALTGARLQYVFSNSKILRRFNIAIAAILMASLYPIVF